MQHTLDTSGVVQFRDDHGELMTYRWSDLTPFVQGYIEALFFDPASDAELWQAKGGILGFDRLAPETLARILKDCEEMVRNSRGYLKTADQGREAWVWRQDGVLIFPPLTPILSEDGLIRFKEGQ